MNPENVIQQTLQQNVATFEAIYEKVWDKREDLAKLLVTPSTTFLVSVASLMKLFYPGNAAPNHFLIFAVLLLIPIFLACISLWLLAKLRGLKVAAFEKRHESKGVFDACFVGEQPDLTPFAELVFEIVAPARNTHYMAGRVLAFGYASLFLILLYFAVGLACCP